MKVIGISCGIGRSFEEAARAVVKAKKHKGKEYNIEVYSGKRLRSKIPTNFKKKIDSYLEFCKKIGDEQKKMLENFSLHDPITGLLNKTGFFLRLEQLKRMKIEQGYYMLFDLDDLHKWNEKIGYARVDKKLGIIGREILSNIRHHRERAADILGHRLNESAGDEFLIFFPSKHDDENLKLFIKRAKSIINGINKKQKKAR